MNKEFKADKFRVMPITEVTSISMKEEDHKLKLNTKQKPTSEGVGVEVEDNKHPGTYCVVLFVKPNGHGHIIYEDVDGRVFKTVSRIILHKDWNELKDFVKCVNRAYKIVNKTFLI